MLLTANSNKLFASVGTGSTYTDTAVGKSVEPDYDWGWGANIGYIFPNTGNDIDLSYFHFGTDDKNSVFANPVLVDGIFINGILIPNIIFVGGTNLLAVSSPIVQASANLEYDVDQVDLTGGQFVNIGCRTMLHPAVGVRWAQLDRSIDSYYLARASVGGVPVGPPSYLNEHEKSEFDGVGPLAKLDASYYLGYGFGAVAHADAGLLIGNKDVYANVDEGIFNVLVGSTTLLTFNNKIESTRRIVPFTDTKLGLDYTFVFNNTANSDLTLEAGWQVNYYFNAIDRLTLARQSFPTGAIIPVGHRTSNLGMSGPYVTLMIHI